MALTLCAALVLTGLAAGAAQATAVSTGTITVTKGGTRTATDTDAGYANPLGGASFEYAAYVNDVSLATWFPLCTDADNDGSCTGPALANGRYLVRETAGGAPAGWRPFQQLAWGGGSSGQSPTRPYVGDVTVAGANVTARPSNVFPTTAGSGSGSFINAKNNPSFPQSCGIDLALVLDRSGSINDQPGEADAYKSAAQSFINSLAGTPTRVKIFSFAASASADQNSFLDLSVPANVTAANSVIAGVYASTGGGTNWDAGLDLASGAGVDAAIVITDGNPTVRDSSSAGAGTSSVVDLLDLTFGIASANKIKTIGKNGTSQGAKVIGVGVGDGVTAANIEAISAPGDAYTSSLTQLQDTLKRISNTLCGSRIKVRKLVTGVAGQENVPQAGWEFLASSTNAAVNGGFAYEPGSGLTAGTPAEILIRIDKLPASGAPVTIDETQGSQYDFASAACATGSYGGPAVAGTSVNAGSQALTLPDVDRNQDIFCTFTNARKTGRLEVRKSLAPADDPGRFNLQIDGATAGTGSAVGHGGATGQVSLTSGSHTVGETAAAGSTLANYTSSVECRKDGGTGSVVASSAAGASVSVAVDSASDIVCVITNTRRTGHVKVVKDIVPVDGQIGDPGRFDLSIDGEGGYDAVRTNAGDGDSVELTVPNGSVDLSEAAGTATNLGDYTSTYRCVAAGHDDVTGNGTAIDALPVAAGDEWVCTLTNTRKKGHVKLVKKIVAIDAQLGDAGRFDLSIDGEGGYDAVRTNAGDGDSVELRVPNGSVDLSEAAGTATNLGDYTSTYRCVAAGHDDVTGNGTAIDALPVAAGDSWTCTLTNTRKQASVRLTKHITAVDARLGDPGRFDLLIDGAGAHDAAKHNAVDGDAIEVGVPNGTVDLSETAGTATSLADYTSAYRCVNTAGGNDDAPVTGDATAIAGLVVTGGDHWECTFTNTRKKGHIKLIKDIVPVNATHGDAGTFDLHIDGEGGYDAVKTGAGDGDFVELTVPNGTVDLSESAGPDTGLGDYTSAYRCVAAGHDDVTGNGTNIADLPVTAGDNWVCTLTNTRKKGTVTVIKHLSPTTDAGLFNLVIMGPLDHSATGHDRGHNGSVSLDVPTGTASVSETAGTGTELGAYLSSYRCENAAQGSEDAPLKGAGTSVPGIVVDAGDDWVCTFTNVRKPRITIKKLTEPAGDDRTSFAFTSDLPAAPADEGAQAIAEDGSFTLKHGQQVTTLATPGSYSVTEGDVYAQNYRLKSVVCTEAVPNDARLNLESGQQSAGDRTRSFTADPGDVITCTFVNEKLVGLQVVAKTPKSQSAYIDQNVSYSYDVTNTGTSDLTNVTVVDDKCPGPAARQADRTGDNDAVLEPGEVWSYTCTVAASAIFTGDITRVTNTVTVNAKDQAGKPVPPSTDTAVTNLLKPGIAIDKTGPATATAGDLLTYSLKVTNTGDTTFSDGMVVLTDALCQAPPALLSRNGDASPETLSPGESWTYSCQVQTQVGQQKVDNVGSVKGTDQGARIVTASDTASTTLSQAAAQALPNPPVTRIPGSAKLRGTVGCAIASYASAAIKGKQIKSVTFYVNGKKVRTQTKPTGGQFSLRLNVRSLRYGTHKVTAKVVFSTASRTTSKTLTLQFSRCRPRVVQPKFTG